MIGVIEQWLPAVLAVAAWPAGVVVMVLGVLVLVPREQQVAVLGGIAEIVRAARGKSPGSAAPAGAARAEDLPATAAVGAELSAAVRTPNRAELG